MEKLAYRISEAAFAAGLSRSKLYQEIKSGKLRARKVGGRRLILKKDLLAYLDAPGSAPGSQEERDAP
ncbi:MAG: helix-turn-helix domain-containing protein [Alphaproteobacteria bacterium]|jgi:excisionase family DNA binding protein|nr:helix-turn-helix domain-containing protein [Alphaproteobacteria bacterium]MBN9593464.1 helix-turn-helix domain-containing protein [Alphaproteobacteria bacterium]